MTISNFLALLTILSGANALLTQAVKKMMDGAGRTYSSNMTALVNAIVCGFGGTLVWYLTAGEQINSMAILMAALMAVSVWIGSMVGYDKVTQMIRQIGETGYGRD